MERAAYDVPLLVERLRRRRPDLGRVEVLAQVGSTSTALVGAAGEASAEWPDRSVLVADHQVAGRGRRGRTWQTPPGAAVTVSVLLRPPARTDEPLGRGWVPLLTGLATVRALAEVGGPAVGVKWPNDVLLREAEGHDGVGKVAGVLAEVVQVAGEHAVVVGVGVNVDQERAELPVPTAASCRTAGHPVDRAALVVSLVGHLLDLEDRRRDGDRTLVDEVTAACATLGTRVRVELPGGAQLRGLALGLAPDGGLVVRQDDGALRTVLAGDVHHIRPLGGG